MQMQAVVEVRPEMAQGVEPCHRCGQAPAVTTEGDCETCDQKLGREATTPTKSTS